MKLKKELNLLDVFSITLGAIISSGLFLLPGLAHAKAGPAVIISYLLAGLLATAGMLSQAELASAMPKTGGTYFYVTRSMGPAVGTVYGLVTLLSLSLKSSFELIGMAAYTMPFLHIDIRIIAAVLCLIFLIINIIGVKDSSKIQVVLVFCILTALFFYVLYGIPNVRVQNFEPFTPMGTGAILSTAGFVFVSFGGLLKVASLAEEIKNPHRSLPLGMILSLAVVILLYMVIIFVTVGILGTDKLDHSLTPLPDAAAVTMGTWGMILLSIVAVFAFISAANAGIMGASRYPYALSLDNMLPEIFGKVNSRFKTPHPAILLTGFFMLVSLFLKVDIIIKAASCVLILTYMFSCLAHIIMRESNLQNYQPPFRAPLYPWIQIAGIIGFSVLLFEIGKQALFISLILIIGGFFVYWFYGRIRATREFALLHLIERITAKELTSHSLETELKEIIRERDDIIKDRFDHIIEECAVLNINDDMNVVEFFTIAAGEMAPRLDVQADELLKLFLEREKESSTVLSPFLAIPHIIIEGENKFDILLARCRGGIVFSESAPRVHTVFVLVGTKDERHFHLRTLAAIAQIVQNSHFEERWMAVNNKERLRDIVLLGKRRRH